MTAVVFAYHDVGCLGLRTLARLGADIAAVYTHDDDPRENTWFGSVRATCAELGLEVLAGNDPNSSAEQDRIRALRPTAFFSFYYRDLLTEALLAIPARGGVNLHGSLLPRYRGRAPVNWMILHGEREGGVTLHYMVRKADAGDIVDQEAFPIDLEDTPTEVYAKLLPAAQRVLERSAISVLEGTAPRARQLESKATVFGRRRPEDGLIEWCQAAEDVRNLVRAVTRPYPGAFSFVGGRKLLIWSARHEAHPGREPRTPGMISREHDGLYVSCGDRRRLRLLRVELDSREGDPLEFKELRDGVSLAGTPGGGD